MDKEKVIQVLNQALEYEMGSVVKLLHHSFLVFGPGRGPLQQFLRTRVNDSITHATQLGEKITALGGHPSINVRVEHAPGEQSIEDMLREDLENEQEAVTLYRENLDLVANDVPLDQMFRDIICEEQGHVEEFEKMLRK